MKFLFSLEQMAKMILREQIVIRTPENIGHHIQSLYWIELHKYS